MAVLVLVKSWNTYVCLNTTIFVTWYTRSNVVRFFAKKNQTFPFFRMSPVIVQHRYLQHTGILPVPTGKNYRLSVTVITVPTDRYDRAYELRTVPVTKWSEIHTANAELLVM